MRLSWKAALNAQVRRSERQGTFGRIGTDDGVDVMKYFTVHFNVTQWFLAIFMEHRLNTAFSVA